MTPKAALLLLSDPISAMEYCMVNGFSVYVDFLQSLKLYYLSLDTPDGYRTANLMKELQEDFEVVASKIQW